MPMKLSTAHRERVLESFMASVSGHGIYYINDNLIIDSIRVIYRCLPKNVIIYISIYMHNKNYAAETEIQTNPYLGVVPLTPA